MRRLLLMLTPLLFLTGSLLAQTTKTVTGKVTDSNGDALPGVTVQVAGTQLGTVTDVTGSFKVNMPSGSDKLIFRLIGMETQTITVGTNTNLNITMKIGNSNIDEVVVVGYGSARKIGSVVGSVAKVSSDAIQNRPAANVMDALQGQVAGLQIYTSSGEPSATSSFRIHGNGSLGAGSTPLILMDGVPIDPATVVTLNPNDIESFTVLKDASSTAIYGSRAANGVIFITTKKGKSGTSNINVNSQFVSSSLANTDFYNNFMNTKQLTDFWLETGYRSQAQIDDLLERYPFDTKWYKYYYKEGVPLSQNDISITGGNDKTTYFISGGYLHSEGLAYRSNYDRFTGRSNVSSKVTDWFRMGVNLSGSYDKTQTNPYGSNSTNRGLALLAQPFYSPVDENGKEYPDLIPGWNRYNPKYLADKIRSDGNKQQINISGYLEANPINNLTLRTQAGLEANDYRLTDLRLPSYLGSLNNGSTSEQFARTVNRTITNTIEYKYDINLDHHLTALVGQEYIDNKNQSFRGTATGQTVDGLVLLSSGPNGKDATSGRSEYSFLSYFGRLDYNFKDKYYLQLTGRQDQSSRFGKDNRTARFWSVGGMWKVSREDFMNEVNWLQDLTVRLSYGITGNADIGNYNSLALTSTNQYNGGSGYFVSTPGDPNLSWESQKQTNIGFSFGLFNKLYFDIDLYNRNTSNMLVDVPFPYTSGYSSVTQNVGSLNNKGIDFNLNANIIQTRDFKLTAGINFNYNKEKVEELFDGKQYWIIPNTGVSWAVGQPRSYFYPIFKSVNPTTGMPEWYLPNADPDKIVDTRKDPNAVSTDFIEADLQQNTGIKRYAPFNGGWNVRADYKGIYLSTNWSFSGGKYLINNDRYFFENPNVFPGYNQSTTVLDYWKKEGDVTRFPSFDEQFTQFDSRLIENASFIRMKVLQIGYQLPQELLKKTNFFKSVGIYFIGRNLLTFTKYSGPDPEVDSNLTLGAYPNTRQIGGGVQLQF